MFSGEVGRRRKVSAAGARKNRRKGRRELLAQAKAERADRELKRREEEAGRRLRAWGRSALRGRRFRARARAAFDAKLSDLQRLAAIFKATNKPFHLPAATLGNLLLSYIGFNQCMYNEVDKGRLTSIAALLNTELEDKRDRGQPLLHVVVATTPWWENLMVRVLRDVFAQILNVQADDRAMMVRLVQQTLLPEMWVEAASSETLEEACRSCCKRIMSRMALSRNPSASMFSLLVRSSSSPSEGPTVLSLASFLQSAVVANFPVPSSDTNFLTRVAKRRWFDDFARIILLSGAGHPRSTLFNSVIERIVTIPGVWRACLHAVLRCRQSTNPVGIDAEKRNFDTLETLVAIAARESTRGIFINDAECSAAHVRLLYSLMPLTPPTTLRTSSSEEAFGIDSDADEMDEEYGQKIGGVGVGDAAATSPDFVEEAHIRCSFASVQMAHDDFIGAASRLLRGVHPHACLRRAAASLAGRGSGVWTPRPGDQLYSLTSTDQAVALFESLLPPKDVGNTLDMSGAGAGSGVGGESGAPGGSNATAVPVYAAAVVSLAALYDQIFSWLGILMEDRDQQCSQLAQNMLNVLSLSSRLSLVSRLWTALKDAVDLSASTHESSSAAAALGESKSVHSAAAGTSIGEDAALQHAISFFFTCYGNLLLALDDEEVYENERPFSFDEQRKIVEFISSTLRRLCWEERPYSFQPSRYPVTKLRLVTSGTRLFRQLYDRNCRRRFCDPRCFVWNGIPQQDFFRSAVGYGGQHNAEMAFRAVLILSQIPQTIAFDTRLQIFKRLQEVDRAKVGNTGYPGTAARITIRRDRLLQDAIDSLPVDSRTLRGRIQVSFVDEHGIPEAGIDGGGLFKEFIDSVSREIFRPEYGLFKFTEQGNLLYPNPLVEHAGMSMSSFEFMGRLLGKALYESVLVEPRFANFFLNKILGRNNFFDDLQSLDPELYKNVRMLKTMTTEVRDLDLTFSVSEEIFGSTTRTVDLVPGGSDLIVDEHNRLRYMGALANYYLNRRISAQSRAFLHGLRKVIPVGWIRMFNQEEMQMMIGGTSKSFDVADMQRHTNYSGGYHESQPYIQGFWSIVASLSSEDVQKLLRFVTSCSRPPLRGFRDLYPPLCIRKVNTDARLPTAATCMNLLKLPVYENVEVLREKLLLAINNGVGFGLS